jgi:hypothetical protein
MDLFSQNNSEQAIYLEYEGDKSGNFKPDAEEIGIKPLKVRSSGRAIFFPLSADK